MNGFVGGGAHWRVLPVRLKGFPALCWQVYRRHWDHWEAVGYPHRYHLTAMTEANRLARLNRA